MLVTAWNVWTGSPLLALWIGSRLQGSGPPKMGPVFAVLVAFGVLSFSLASLLARLGDSYNRILYAMTRDFRTFSEPRV